MHGQTSFENSENDKSTQGATQPPTNAQKAFIQILNDQTGEHIDPDQVKDRAEASEAIEKLKPEAEEKQVSHQYGYFLFLWDSQQTCGSHPLLKLIPRLVLARTWPSQRNGQRPKNRVSGLPPPKTNQEVIN